jgi:crossover junction endodeoxyribonuclease RuvC
MKVIGLDLSLTSTGVAVATQDGAVTDRITSKPVPNATLEDRDVRLYAIERRVMEYVTGDVDLVVVEGPSYGSTTGHQHDRAGLWWLVVDALFRRGQRVVEVPPSSRMKYATGRGNASKDDVLSAVIRRYPHVDVNGNDEADALILAAMGARHLERPLEPGPYLSAALPKQGMSKACLVAMGAVHWPNPDRIAG